MVRHRPRCSQRRESTSRCCGGTTLGATAGPLAPSTYPSAASGGLFPFFYNRRRRAAVAGDGRTARCEDGRASGLPQLRRARRAAQHRGGQRRPSSGGRARGGRRSRTRGGGFLRYGVFTESIDDARMRVCKVVIILLIWAV